MHVLLVHGMGRSPLSMVWLGRNLRRANIQPEYFGYVAAVENVDRLVSRLTQRLIRMADHPYIVVGHSLGGVLLRLAVAGLPKGVRQPEHLILLASPHATPRLARRLARNYFYRAFTGDAGQMLGDASRMAAVPLPNVPYSVVVGTKGFVSMRSPFAGEPNDGVVAVSEARLSADDRLIQLPRIHTFIMNADEVCRHIEGTIANHLRKAASHA